MVNGGMVGGYYGRGCLGILLVGIIGSWVVVGAIGYGIYWLCKHIDISWVS